MADEKKICSSEARNSWFRGAIWKIVRNVFERLEKDAACVFCALGRGDEEDEDFDGVKYHAPACPLYGFEKTDDVDALHEYLAQRVTSDDIWAPRPNDAPPVFTSARSEGLNTRCDACGYSLGAHTVAIGQAGAGCPTHGVPELETADIRVATYGIDSPEVKWVRKLTQLRNQGVDVDALIDATRVDKAPPEPNGEHYKQLWDDSCRAVVELCLLAGAKRSDMPDLWTLEILIKELRSDVRRLSEQAERVTHAWEEDPTSLATENAINELKVRTPRTETPQAEKDGAK